MKRIIAILLTILFTGIGQVAASPLVTPSNLRLDRLAGHSAVEKITNAISQPDRQSAVHTEHVNRQMEAKALIQVGHVHPIEGDAHAWIFHPVTRSISFSFAYSLKESEDLIEHPIQSGAVFEGYENHTVLLRANWQFN